MPLSVAAGIKAGQMGAAYWVVPGAPLSLAVISCKRLYHEFYDGLWWRK